MVQSLKSRIATARAIDIPAIAIATKPDADSLLVSAWWRDRDVGNDGRETLPVWLSAPLGDLITEQQLRYHRALVNFWPEKPDHLATRYWVRSQPQARRMICAAARTLHFMDATRLRPSKSFTRAFAGRPWKDRLPGLDHPSIWYNPETKRYLIADEPYESRIESKAADRAAWAQRRGFVMVKPSWPGMYNPRGGSRLYLFAHEEKGIPLEPIVAALDSLPSPIVEATWCGDSIPSWPLYV
jgi:hypothetical protein